MTNQTNINPFNQGQQLPSQQELNECSQPVDVALLWASRGVPVIPCKPSGAKAKAPYTKRGFHEASTDPEQINLWWERWPNALIGGVIGKRGLVVVDLDLKSVGNGIEQLKKLEAEHGFTVTGPTVRTQSGGVHIYMIAPDAFFMSGLRANLKDFGAPQIDLKGEDTGYVILPGSIMADGRRYDWKDGHDPVTVGPQYMPPALAQMAHKSCFQLTPVEELSSSNYHSGPTPEEIEAALKYLPADDYADWVLVGQILKGHFGEYGFSVWDQFSQKSAKYNQSGMRAKWDTFDKTPGGGATIATIFHMCKQHGGDPSALAKEHRGNGTNTATANQPGTVQAWSVPQPLTAKISPEPYPIDALPDPIREAVEEVAGFTQAPLPMIATSALTAISVATQGHVDVCRAPSLSGLSCLYGLGIAESGERKSTVDGYFTKPIVKYQSALDEASREEWDEYKVDKTIWDAKKAGLKQALALATKNGDPTDDIEDKIEALKEPDEPKTAKYLYDDATPEELAYAMFKRWRVAALIVSEAGSVLGGHGMNPDSVMRALSLLNKFWSGEVVDIARRTSESYRLEGARFTISLQVQEKVLRTFFERAGDLARGSGFLARFLIYQPDSTIGYRPWKQPPEGWPALTSYHNRIRELLQQPLNFKVTGEGFVTDIPEPFMLAMEPDAQQAWIDFYNAVEASCRPGGEAHEVKDVASKTADNAARIAAVFHCYLFGPTGQISREIFDGASRIAAWHLHEARRFLGEHSLPQELADAARLDRWLLKHCETQGVKEVAKNYVRQYGPVRDGKRLAVAIDELVSLERIREVVEGRKTILQLNPGLL